MLYCFGVGEVPISIVSDPASDDDLEHTIRIVGHVTQAMARWQEGDAVGIRGPYGRGWPIDEARGRDVIVITGGLGCAPVAGAIHYILERRAEFGQLQILHGVKAPRELLYRERFRQWRSAPRTRVYLTADEPDADWHYDVGVVTDLFDELDTPPGAIVLMCGPEVMMRYAGRHLIDAGVPEESIHVSMERNMKCAIGLCGHCQLGGVFACKDGPVFRYDEVRPIFAMEAR
jgi:NAD(P)H-flavin reductase